MNCMELLERYFSKAFPSLRPSAMKVVSKVLRYIYIWGTYTYTYTCVKVHIHIRNIYIYIYNLYIHIYTHTDVQDWETHDWLISLHTHDVMTHPWCHGFVVCRMFATFLRNKVVCKLVPYAYTDTHTRCVFCTSDAANSAQATNSRQFAILSHELNDTTWIRFLALKQPMTSWICCVSWVCDFMHKKVMGLLVPYAHAHAHRQSRCQCTGSAC